MGGETSRQMAAAPRGAVYVWCNHHLDYPVDLAMQLGRGDLRVVPPSWLEEGRWRGLELTGLVVDHAVVDHAAGLSDSLLRALSEARTRVRPGCAICGRLLGDPRDPVRSLNCGGDCLRCVAEAGDPECLAAMRQVEPGDPAWGRR